MLIAYECAYVQYMYKDVYLYEVMTTMYVSMHACMYYVGMFVHNVYDCMYLRVLI